MCGWFINKDLLIGDFSDECFLVMARNEPQRELLIASNPLREYYENTREEWIANNKKSPRIRGGIVGTNHQTNIQLLLSPVFWLKVESLVPILNPVSLALNFGRWETECHGHAHLELSEDTMKSLARKYKVLEGRYYPQKDYLREDIISLEQRILFATLERLEKKIDAITQ